MEGERGLPALREAVRQGGVCDLAHRPVGEGRSFGRRARHAVGRIVRESDPSTRMRCVVVRCGSSVQVRLPVQRHPSRRAGGRLTDGVVFGWGKSGALIGSLIAVVVVPVLAGLEACDQRMAAGLGVGGGVLGGGSVAAADVAALGAAAQVKPPPVALLALLAAGAARRGTDVDARRLAHGRAFRWVWIGEHADPEHRCTEWIAPLPVAQCRVRSVHDACAERLVKEAMRTMRRVPDARRCRGRWLDLLPAAERLPERPRQGAHFWILDVAISG